MRRAKIEDLTFRVVADMKSAFVMAMSYVGNHLGLFHAMAGAGALTSAELARRTKLDERNVRDWAEAMAGAGYIDYDVDSDRFSMTEEQAFVLVDKDGPLFATRAFRFSTASPFDPRRIQGFLMRTAPAQSRKRSEAAKGRAAATVA